ncbi:MAG: APC family permease [Erysipelotrichaceae bacterium]
MSNKSETAKKKFGLLTTVAMIAGIVIGSGIFFQTPKVISAVNGNIWLGISGYLIVASSIIFGGISVSQFSRMDDKAGGLIRYCEIAWGKTLGFLAGWTQCVLYYPAIIAVVGWVAANYLFALFGKANMLTSAQAYINGGLSSTVSLWTCAIAIILCIYTFNIVKTKYAGKFQSISLVAKLCALIFLTIVGLIFGEPLELFSTADQFPANSSAMIAVLATIAFAYDGWLIAPTIAHEIKDAKKNLTKALIFAPLLITIIYVLFFISLTSFVGPQAILDGADPTAVLATSIFGDIGMKVIFSFVIISIFGSINGLILVYIRTPYSLAIRNEIPFSKQLAKINKKYDIPVNSAFVSLLVVLIWMFLHFSAVDGSIFLGWNFAEGLAIDILPIVIMYFFYSILYLGVMLNISKNFTKSKLLYRWIAPILALIGSLIIIFGAVSDPKFILYISISAIVLLMGLLLKPRKNV